MITSLNKNNQAKYTVLFEKAYDDLKKANLLTPEEIAQERYTKLEEYFTRIEDLAKISNTYLMLPLDEEIFEINANTRVITVPPLFKKSGVSVQGDEIAETLMFKIDRFFDYMDLASPEIILYVQWTTPKNEEGASIIKMIDYETEPGKILFAWPLTSAITKTPGQVKFSVRFFKTNTAKQVIYSFNTLQQVITINSALQPEINVDGIDDATELFNAAITNSQPSSGVIAAEPYFPKDTNLPVTANLSSDNTLVFTVQALASDIGVISYEWVYQNTNGELTTLVDNVKEEKIKTNDTERQENKVYYYKVTQDDGSTVWKVYGGDNLSDSEYELFENFSQYTIIDSEDEVVGKYQVIAKNRSGTSTSKGQSAICEIPGPKEIIYDTDLNETAFLEETNKLSVSVTAKESPDITLSYQWKKTTEPQGVLENIEGETTNILSISEAGWYQVESTGSLNRASLSESSKVCKVTNYPTIPVVISPVASEEGKSPRVYDDLDEGDTYTCSVVIQEYNNQLLSEEVVYKWYYAQNDSETKEELLEGDEKIVSGLGTSSLTIKRTSSAVDEYICEVINKLNGKEATTDKLSPVFILT